MISDKEMDERFAVARALPWLAAALIVVAVCVAFALVEAI